jgi:hypothetical protein
MKRLLVSASLALSIALGVLATACSGPNGAQLLPQSNGARTISAGAGAGNPSSFPQPTLAPGQNDCVKLAPGSSSNTVVINVNGKLSAANATLGFSASSCDAEPETIGFQYTVSTNTNVADCGNVTTPVPAGSVTISGNGGKSFTINVPIPNCPNTTRNYLVTVTAFVPNGTSAGRVLTSIQSAFEETDLGPNSPGVKNGVLQLSGTFVPDPATSPLASASWADIPAKPVAYSYSLGGSAELTYSVITGYENGFIGVFLNGAYWGNDNLGIDDLNMFENFTSELRTADFVHNPALYLQPCPTTVTFTTPNGVFAPLCGLDSDGFNTQTELHAGDKVEFFPIAFDPSSGLMKPLLSPGPIQVPTVVGPRIGSATMQLVAN